MKTQADICEGWNSDLDIVGPCSKSVDDVRERIILYHIKVSL